MKNCYDEWARCHAGICPPGTESADADAVAIVTCLNERTDCVTRATTGWDGESDYFDGQDPFDVFTCPAADYNMCDDDACIAKDAVETSLGNTCSMSPCEPTFVDGTLQCYFDWATCHAAACPPGTDLVDAEIGEVTTCITERTDCTLDLI